jgi:hypothetical protein
MADKVPIKATFDSAGDAEGLSEYVSGDTLGYAHGGTGLSALGSAGQVLRTNGAANAIEWGAAELLNIDGMTDGSSITIGDTDKFAISDGGTEKYVLASQIKTYVGPLSLIDEDDMSTDSATRPPSQQSTKAYVDTHAALGTHLTLIDEDNFSTDSATRPPSQQSVKAYVDASGLSLIDEDDFATDSATRPPSQQSVKAYISNQGFADIGLIIALG